MSERGSYERFFWFDGEVRAGRCPSAAKLAERFEVSTKTAQRDIDFMRDRLNAPLEYDMRRKGWRYADENFFLPFTSLSSRQLSALLVARQMLKGIAGDGGGELSVAVERITSILGRTVGSIANVDEAVSFELIQFAPVDETVFAAVLEACLNRRVISFIYYSPATDTETKREVEPYHLFNYMGTWHLVGYSRERQGLRDFVLARMRDLTVRDETFRLRRGFDAVRHRRSAFGIFKGAEREKHDVTLRFTAERAKWVRGQRWFDGQTARDLPDGALELTFPVVSHHEVVMEILKHGAGVEVVRPAALRERIAAEAAALLRLYEKHP